MSNILLTLGLPQYRYSRTTLYFDEAQHERRAGFGGGRRGIFRNSHHRHRPVIARSLRRSDLADFWEGIGHRAGRGIATSLIAPCRRPRPVGAMTKKKRAARFGGSTHTSTGLSMSGGRGSPEIPRFFIRRSSIPRSSIRHLTFGIRHFPKTSCAPPTQCCMLQPKSRTSTIPWRVCKDALSRSVSMTGFFFCG